MPIEKLQKWDSNSGYAIWRLEAGEDLIVQEPWASVACITITHPQKRQECMAARAALRHLLDVLGESHTELCKDAWGRPYLAHSQTQISLSHSGFFAVAAAHRLGPIGVDVQYPQKKLLEVSRRFLTEQELASCGQDLEQLCIYWSAKEAIYKAAGGRGLSLRNDISIDPFRAESEGLLRGWLGTALCSVRYSFYKGYVLAWCSSGEHTKLL